METQTKETSHRKGYSKNGKKLGRPRKDEIRAVSKGNRGKVGRPKGDSAIMNEYKSRMLARPDSEDVLNSIYAAALDDKHKNQAAAWKIITDRMLPIRAFENAGGNSRPQVSINISSVGEVKMDQGENVIEGEIIEDSE